MKNLASALIKFQSELEPVVKGAENPFFKSMFADLSSILEQIIPLLSSNGLALSQPMRVEGDKIILMTKIIHSSGEELVSEMILPQHADPQKFGALITYYKRYQLSALLSISTKNDDDDGNSVSHQHPKINNQQKYETPVEQSNDEKRDMIKRQIYAISKKNNINQPTFNTLKEAEMWVANMNSKK